MVNFIINTGIRKIADQIIIPVQRAADAAWFSENITILLSPGFIGTLVFDFAFDVPSVIEYTLDNESNWIPFNNGDEMVGGQSRYIDVTSGVQVNLRAKTTGNLIRCIVSSIP